MFSIENRSAGEPERAGSAGLAGWIVSRLRRTGSKKPRLELLEKIALAPRQTVALIEADGRRFLIACSPEGGASFCPLDTRVGAVGDMRAVRPGRVSW